MNPQSTPEVSRAEFDALKAELARNTEITREVRDILATFSILFRIAKWTAAVAASATAMIGLWDAIASHLHLFRK